MDFTTFDVLVELLGDSTVMPFMKDDILNGLVLLRAILIDNSLELVEDSRLQLESLVSKAEFICSKFDGKEMNEYMALEVCLQLRDLDLYFAFSVANKIFEERQTPPSEFYSPRTSPMVFIDHLLENLEELVNDTASSVHHFRNIILNLHWELDFWKSDLREISRDPPLHMKSFIEEIIDLAYEVEYVIDSFLVRDIFSWECIYMLTRILEKFNSFECEGKHEGDDKEDLNMKKPIICDMLFKGGKQLNMISISGQAGIGKARFGKELYDSSSNHFDARAVCPISWYFNGRSYLLRVVISQLIPLPDNILEKSYEELRDLLYKCLEGRKFLIVIDDFSVFEWEILRECIPPSQNGSRILFTTTERDFTFPIKSNNIMPPRAPLHDKIWEILRKSLFQKETCPPRLSEVGKKIAKRCKISSITQVIANLKTKKTVARWEEIARTLGSRIVGDASYQEKHLVELSYTFLSDSLRSCYLYLAICLDNPKDIIVSKLIRLWIAEGFIKHTTSQSLEDTAADYVANLLALKLLKSHQEKTIGGAKTCGPNLLLHDFLLYKVMEENFLQLINGYDQLFQSSKKTPDYGLNPNFSSSSSTSTIYHQHHLRIYAKRNHFIMLKPSGPFAKSLLFFAASDDNPSYSYDISFIFNNFKFLRILDFEDIYTGESFKKIHALVLLRYLAIQSSADFIPSSIANLWNLETFILKGLKHEVVKVPDSIWDMTKLRHIHISNPSFNVNPQRLEHSSPIPKNLQTFSTPLIAYGDDMEKLLRRLAGIQKLKCRFLDTENCDKFPMLDFLNQLISLNVSYRGKYPCDFNFPSNLKKLTLSYFRMPWFKISQLALLCNLEVLKLLKYSFDGERWDMEDHVVFPKLKYLKLQYLLVKKWSATRDHFPHLEHLFVNDCQELSEIPQDFAYINTLRLIEGRLSNSLIDNAARLIQREHMKLWGNDKLEVLLERNFY